MKRRTFIKAAGVSSAATLMSGLPAGWVGSVYADDSPEVKAMRFGMIALTDCAPIVMAHELGYFKKFGIESTISKEASWAVIRDKLSLGENHATHMLIGMPIASTMGLAGSPVKPMVIPWVLNRNGQAMLNLFPFSGLLLSAGGNDLKDAFKEAFMEQIVHAKMKTVPSARIRTMTTAPAAADEH